MSLSKHKLINVRPCADGYTAGCPACGRAGADSQHMHLRVWNTGRWSCAVHPGDKEHNRVIYAIAGDGTACEEVGEAPAPRQMEAPKTWDANVLEKLIPDHSYWVGRGVSEGTVAPFRGGVAMTAQMKGRYVFPMFDPLNDERIIGFSGRLVAPMGDAPVWKHLGSKSAFIWGGVDECESTRRVILVESIGDALSLMERGVKDVLVLFGITLSQALLAKVIALNPSSIIISTNRDTKHTVGQDAAARIAAVMRRFFDESVIRVVLPPEREGQKDWGTATAEEIAAAFGA